MSKCPKCSKEIDELKFISTEKICGAMVSNGHGTAEYDIETQYTESEEFVCPECLEVLFTEEEKAMEFLEDDKNDTY